jgi:hypothetical protein
MEKGKESNETDYELRAKISPERVVLVDYSRRHCTYYFAFRMPLIYPSANLFRIFLK